MKRTTGTIIAVLALAGVLTGCGAEEGEGPFIRHVKVCGQVLAGYPFVEQPLLNRDARFVLGVSNKLNGYVYRNDAVVHLDSNTGVGCATFELGDVSGHISNLRPTELGAYVPDYDSDHNSASGKVNRHSSDWAKELISLDVTFDLFRPSDAGPPQWAGYILKQILKRPQKSPASAPASKASDQMAAKTVEPRRGEIPARIQHEVTGTHVL